MAGRSDYLVIGSGAGGSALTHRLAAAGATVTVLERGERLPADGSTQDVGAVFGEGRFRSGEAWQDGAGQRRVPEEYFNLGGKTQWYGAALLRFAPAEFAADGALSAPAWPFGPDGLERYYDQAEALLGLHRFPVEPDLRRLLDGLHRQDPAWRERPMPLGLDPAILDHPHEARHFDGFASTAGLKADAQRRVWDPLAGEGTITVHTGARVTALLPGSDPRTLAGAETADGRRFEADRVVLAAGALHTPRLLQGYLDGPGSPAWWNGADAVGRYLKLHLNAPVLVVGGRRVHDPLRKTALLEHPTFPRSSVQNLGWVDGELLAHQLPGWLPRPLIEAVGRRAYGFWVTTEDGSHPDNRVLPGDGTAPPRLDYDPTRIPVAEAEHRRLLRTLRRQFAGQGLAAFPRRLPLEGTAHACGTCRTGDDPATSVVDPVGRIHGLDNGYVADGSALPRSSRVNPGLTIHAWALRVADHLARNPARGNPTADKEAA